MSPSLLASSAPCLSGFPVCLPVSLSLQHSVDPPLSKLPGVHACTGAGLTRFLWCCLRLCGAADSSARRPPHEFEQPPLGPEERSIHDAEVQELQRFEHEVVDKSPWEPLVRCQLVCVKDAGRDGQGGRWSGKERERKKERK